MVLGLAYIKDRAAGLFSPSGLCAIAGQKCRQYRCRVGFTAPGRQIDELSHDARKGLTGQGGPLVDVEINFLAGRILRILRIISRGLASRLAWSFKFIADHVPCIAFAAVGKH